MSRIIWDRTGEKLYETGIDHGVLFPMGDDGQYSAGVPWNGLSAVTESPSGAEATAIYADNIKYLSITSAEEFGATIEAYMYPDEFGQCDGSANIASGVTIGQQNRKIFGLCYRTVLGNDVNGNDHGYKLHIIYGATATPSEKNYNTINDSPEAITFSWEVTTIPVSVTGFKPTASVTIDSTKANPEKLKMLEEILYGKDPTEPDGDDGVEPRLPLPDEIAEIMKMIITSITATAVTGETDLLGKTVTELQTDVVINDTKITGTLHHVTGYTGFNGSQPEEQEGNYLALKFDTVPSETTITVDLVGGTKGPVTLDDDRMIVLRIKNKDSQTVKVTASNKESTLSKTYDLTGLTLESE